MLHVARATAQGTEDAQREAQQVEQWNDSPIAAKAHLPPVDIEAQSQRNIARKQQETRERLEARYDESARAAFQADYDRELKTGRRWSTTLVSCMRTITQYERSSGSVTTTMTRLIRSRSSTSSA